MLNNDCVLVQDALQSAVMHARPLQALSPASTVDIPQLRPLQLGGAEYHRGIFLAVEHSHEQEQAVVLDTANGDIVRVAVGLLRPAVDPASSWQQWQPPAVMQRLAQHLIANQLFNYQGVYQRTVWVASISTPLGKRRCGWAEHQLLAAWLHDEGLRRTRGHSLPNIPDSISLQEILQHLDVASLDLSHLPTEECCAQNQQFKATVEAAKKTASISHVGGKRNSPELPTSELQSAQGPSSDVLMPAPKVLRIAAPYNHASTAGAYNGLTAPSAQPSTSTIVDAVSSSSSSSAAAGSAATAAAAPALQQAQLVSDKHTKSQKEMAAGEPVAHSTGTQAAALVHDKQHELLACSNAGAKHLQGVAFAAGQRLVLSCNGGSSGSSEQLVLQVDQFLARGGIADLYKVKLLQRQTGALSKPQQSAAAAATALSAKAASPPAAAAAHYPNAWLEKGLRLGQYYALKVARNMDTFTADIINGVSKAVYVQQLSRELQDEWQVLQSFAACPSIINAYKFGEVLAAEPAAFDAVNPIAGDASGSSGKHHQPISGVQHTQGHAQGSRKAAGLAVAAALALPCILMEYADGGSAWDLVYTQHGQPTAMPAAEAWKLVYGVLMALDEMHGRSYIHRDVKLQNVLIITGRFDTRYVLADMGTIYKIKVVTDFAPYTRTGTLQYWPPEMREGHTHHLHYDVYCLGLLLLEARTAQRPFQHLEHLPWEQQRPRRTYQELLASGCCSHLLPLELELLEKCLQVDVTARPMLRVLEKDQYFSSGSELGARY